MGSQEINLDKDWDNLEHSALYESLSFESTWPVSREECSFDPWRWSGERCKEVSRTRERINLRINIDDSPFKIYFLRYSRGYFLLSAFVRKWFAFDQKKKFVPPYLFFVLTNFLQFLMNLIG